MLKADYGDFLTSWKSFTEETLKHVCKVFETDFYIVEVVMSWVALKNPDLKTVRQIFSLLNTSKLDKDYLKHVMQVLKAEGYVVALDLMNCTTEHNPIIFRSMGNMHGVMFTTNSVDGIIKSRTLFAGERISFNKDNFNSGYNLWDKFDFITVTIDSKEKIKLESTREGCSKIYGRTEEGKQIPFFTDVEAAIKSVTSYDVKTLGSLK
jgi:hypothetical protein